MMTMFPGHMQDDELDARRFADALDEIDAGGDPGIDPIEDPELVSLLATVASARDSWGAERPREAYRLRSRVLLLAAYAEDDEVLEEDERELEAAQPRHRRVLPFFLRPAFLAPISSAAAAAAITLGFAFAGGTLDDGTPEVAAVPVVPTGPSAVAVVATEEPAGPNLTSQSAVDELLRIESALREIEVRTQQGQPVDPSLLRAVTQGTVNVASRIESSPDAVPEQIVVTYIQAAATGRTVLDGAQVEITDQAALDSARQAAQDGVEVASRYFLMRSQ